jgi:hypothetical protein
MASAVRSSRARTPASTPPARAATPVHARTGSLLTADIPRRPSRRRTAGGTISLVPLRPLPPVPCAPTHRRSPQLSRVGVLLAGVASCAHFSQPSRTVSFSRVFCAGARVHVFFRSETPRRRTAWRAVWFLSRSTIPRKRIRTIVSHFRNRIFTVKTDYLCGIQCL